MRGARNWRGAMISVQDLEVTHAGGVQARHPTTRRSGAWECTVLLRASGAGKPTLLRFLNRLLRASAGWVEAGGESISGPLRRHRSRTGMMFRQHPLIGRPTVLRN